MPLEINTVVDYLNSLHKADPEAIQSLFNSYSVVVNDKIADHPHATVATMKINGEQSNLLSALGLINGLLTSNGLPRVAIEYDDNTSKLICFRIADKISQPTKK